jgi:hypothetical protein
LIGLALQVPDKSFVLAMAAWSSGIVSACHRGSAAMGREIESRQGTFRVVAFKVKKEFWFT